MRIPWRHKRIDARGYGCACDRCHRDLLNDREILVRERCHSFWFQYRCRHGLGHDGQHDATGDDGSIYAWSRPEGSVTSEIHDLVRLGRITPEHGAIILELRQRILWRRKPWYVRWGAILWRAIWSW